MPGAYRQIGTGIWAEPSIRALPSDAQRAYLLVYTQPDLSFCGVLPYRLKRLANLSSDDNPKKLSKALDILAKTGHIVVDEDAEELLVRTFVRHDGLLAQPQLVSSLVRDFSLIDSTTIRGAFLAELRRIWDLPDITESERRGLRQVFGEGVPERYQERIGAGLVAAFASACMSGSVTPWESGSPSGCPSAFAQPDGEPHTRAGAPSPASCVLRPTPAASSQQGPPDPPGGGSTAKTLLDEHQAELGPLPNLTLADVERLVTKALLDGAHPEHVLAGLAEWRRRPAAKPGLLPHLIADAQRATPDGPSPEVEAWLEAERAKRAAAGAR